MQCHWGGDIYVLSRKATRFEYCVILHIYLPLRWLAPVNRPKCLTLIFTLSVCVAHACIWHISYCMFYLKHCTGNPTIIIGLYHYDGIAWQHLYFWKLDNHLWAQLAEQWQNMSSNTCKYYIVFNLIHLLPNCLESVNALRGNVVCQTHQHCVHCANIYSGICCQI